MRILIVVASFLPFLYYASKDNYFHFHGRKVSVTEHLLHLVIGLMLVLVLSQALVGKTLIMRAGLLLFLIAEAPNRFLGDVSGNRSGRESVLGQGIVAI